MFLNYCGSKCPHKCQDAEWYTSLHQRYTSSGRILPHRWKNPLIFSQRVIVILLTCEVGKRDFAQNVWRGAAVRALNVENLLVTSCCVQTTSTGLFKCVKLSCDCQLVRTEVSGKDARPNKVTWSCCRETKDTNGGKKGDVESGLVYCTLAKVVPSQSIKILCRTISGLNCQRQYDVFALRQSWEAGK